MFASKPRKNWQKAKPQREWRIQALKWFLVLFALLIIFRLAVLQVLNRDFYRALASGQHQMFEKLYPTRGRIFFQDLKDRTLVPVATNRQLAFVYADPRRIDDPQAAADILSRILNQGEEAAAALYARLNKPDDPYEPVARGVDDEALAQIIQASLKGIYYVREPARFYPEPGVGGQIIGFVGANSDGSFSGRYGVEGYFNELLAGRPGFLKSERDIAGRLIAVADRYLEPAVDGADIILTIDRSIQFTVCSLLKQSVARFQADGGSVVVIEPNTGRILAMCGSPDFDPNQYRQVSDLSVFNNPSIFNDYEPGSVFKPITLAAGLDTGAISPSSTYIDLGEVKINEHTIRNSDKKAHGMQNMTQILEKSLNTGAIYVMRQAGIPTFIEYVHRFGFGERVPILLSTEVPGDLKSLNTGHEIYSATASYGQGITVTPLQMAAAYVPIANGGIMKKIHVIDEIRHADGTVEKVQDEDLRRVIESKTARLLSAMLISVIDNGHAAKAGVPGYYLAGKTGTAQVANPITGGYLKNKTIASFVGFGPAEDPRFVVLTRLDHPRANPYGSATAAPLFGEIAAFLLQYFEIPPSR